MLQYNHTVSICLGFKLSHSVSINRSFCRFVSFSFFVSKTIPSKGSRLSFFNKYMFTKNVQREKYKCPPMRANIENTSTGGLLPPVDFIYIRHEINWYHALCPGTAPLNATRPCPRKSAPDPLGRGQKWILGRNTPLLCVIVTVNTTLSGGGQPPSPRKSTRLVEIMSLATGLLCLSVSKIALPSDIDKRIVYRIFFRYPLSDSGTAYSGRLPTLEPALDVGYLQLVICRGSGK